MTPTGQITFKSYLEAAGQIAFESYLTSCRHVILYYNLMVQILCALSTINCNLVKRNSNIKIIITLEVLN